MAIIKRDKRITRKIIKHGILARTKAGRTKQAYSILLRKDNSFKLIIFHNLVFLNIRL
jgi:hypothetical protein